MVQLENLVMIPYNKIDTKTQRYIWRGVWFYEVCAAGRYLHLIAKSYTTTSIQTYGNSDKQERTRQRETSP